VSQTGLGQISSQRSMYLTPVSKYLWFWALESLRFVLGP